MNLDDIIEKNSLWPEKPTVHGECPSCHQLTTLVLTESMTMYEDMARNAPFYACHECSEEYTENMQAQWREYYSGLL